MSKFNPGERVKLSEKGRKLRIYNSKTTGTVIEVSQTNPDIIKVLRDGLKLPVFYRADWWEKQ